MIESPRNIRALQESGVLEIQWRDGQVFQLPYRYLRGCCPCAGCVSEFTGQRIVDVDAIPDAIQPVDITFSGNYALKIVWNDRHDTGLYSWDYLAELCNSQEVDRGNRP